MHEGVIISEKKKKIYLNKIYNNLNVSGSKSSEKISIKPSFLIVFPLFLFLLFTFF